MYENLSFALQDRGRGVSFSSILGYRRDSRPRGLSSTSIDAISHKQLDFSVNSLLYFV